MTPPTWSEKEAIEVLKLAGVPEDLIILLELWEIERLIGSPSRMHIVEEVARQTRVLLASHGIV